ncbi:MAG: BlaI/MecI/CopY family transcriptional regulator [Saccharofermentanales bacterium]
MYQENEFKISESEWLVMHVIWNKQQPMYMGDIVKALSNTPWSRTTIQTMVSRLVLKKVVGTNRTGYAFLYYPLVNREQALKSFTDTFVRRVYNGNAYQLVSELISKDYLSADDRKSLKKLL